MRIDFTQGNVERKLWAFSIPMLVSVMFQQIYNIADSMIAGRFAGEDALAAVGASYPITMLFIAVAMGSNIGCSVVISQAFGARDYVRMKTAVTTTYIACAVLSVVLSVAGFLTSGPLLRMIQTPENIFADGQLYLNIYIGGVTFLFLYNICTGIFNAMGDSRTPLIFLIFSSVGNIILDLWFVIGFKAGVAGVAWATFIAQGASSLLSLLVLVLRLRQIPTEGKVPLFSGMMLRKIVVVAVPSILQQSFISVGNMFIQTLVNGFGSAVIAGYSAAIKLNTFAITSFTTLASGLSTFVAQNVGAGQLDRVRRGFVAGVVMAVCVAAPFFVAYFFLSGPMVEMFMENGGSAEALLAGQTFLRIVAPFYFVILIKLMADGVLRGSGAMSWFMVATFTDLVLRVVLAYVLSIPFGMGSVGIWSSWPIGWTVSAVMSLVFYIAGVWKRKAL
ncbi:MAG TPA: MATE family efflux transporter [Candidatus Anaerofilum excrementigallinarum]|nr:MATE family efflux transporter [Candidatus Anaerofilum excrementigallinarum]